MPFFQWIMGLVTGPFLKAGIDLYATKLKAENTSEKIAADLRAKELDLDARERALNVQLRIAQIGHPFEVEKLFAYITLAYYGKIVVWDKMLELGSTDPLTGAAGVWAGMIITFYFGMRQAPRAINSVVNNWRQK